MSDWKETTLGQLVTFQRGHDLSQTQFKEGIYPIVGSNGIIGYHNEFTTKKNGITIGRSGNIGSPSYIDKDFWAHNTTLYVKEFHNSHPKFIYYLLKTLDFQSFNSGSAVPSLNRNYIHPYPLNAPDYDEQVKIADVLSSLDRKIENLCQQNETLERIAQTLFKHWFVDFEFPNEDGKPYKSSGEEMERSELGETPAGWRIGKLGEFCNVKHGYAFKGESITTEETDQVLLTPGNFKIGGGFNSSKYKYYSDDDYDEEYILIPGDLIITMTDLSKEGDTLGYPAFVPKYSKNVFLHNQRLGKVVNSQIDPFFLFFLLCRREYRSHILGTASGSTVRHTSPSRILDYGFAVPGRELLDRFSLIASNLICKSFSNHEQIQTLTKIRDVLLPKLMSGKLRIKD